MSATLSALVLARSKAALVVPASFLYPAQGFPNQLKSVDMADLMDERSEQGDEPLRLDPHEIPDRVSSQLRSPFYREDADKFVVSIDGKICELAIEYCISQGWVRVMKRNADGKIKQNHKKNSHLSSQKIRGKVEVSRK